MSATGHPDGQATEPVLRCSGLARRFGDRVAVDGVSFEIAPGETYGLLGPNGAGTTTTISMVAGVLAADAGGVTVSRTCASASARCSRWSGSPIVPTTASSATRAACADGRTLPSGSCTSRSS